MQESPDLNIDGAQAIIRLGRGVADVASGTRSNATIVDYSAGRNLECAGFTQKTADGSLFTCELPAALFDGAEHKVGIRSRLWPGEVKTVLTPRDETGELIDVATASGGAPTADVGRLEYFDGDVLRGWGFNRDEWAERSKIDIFVDNAKVATVTADERRLDLKRAGIGDGRHGFQKSMPTTMLDGKRHVITCIFSASRVLLENGIMEVHPEALRRFVMKEIRWRLDKIEGLLE